MALLLLATVPGAARADSLTLDPARAFGYVLGDTLTLEAEIRLDPGARIDPSSLPRPHAVSPWLDLVAVDLAPPDHAADGHYRLRLTYQSFFGPLEPRALDIPAWPLLVREGAARRALEVPAFTFVATPLRELVPSRAGNPMALRPDLPPPSYPLGPDALRAGLAAGVAALGLAALALTRGWRPFRRAARPFAAARRGILQSGAATAQTYRAALLALHRAFDSTAGRRLLGDDVGAFLAREPRFSNLADDVGALFAASRVAFFGAGTEAAMARLPPEALTAIARRLADAERRDPPPAAALPEAAA